MKMSYLKNRNKNYEKKSDAPTDDSNPMISCFRQYAQELDEKHDRYERIVKQSRDVTIESKRIIFLLHTIDPKKNNKSKVIQDAGARLTALCQTHFGNIARELIGIDPYQFTRAYSAGLQEFIEAFTYYEYLSDRSISDWDDIQSQLIYNKKTTDNSPESEEQVTKIRCLVQPIEYILGLGDLSGEVMRKCVNSLGAGEFEVCIAASKFLQNLYTGFLELTVPRSRDFNQKLYTLRQSVLKVENVCYNIKVRGGEAAQWGSVEPMKKDDDIDEGYINY